MRVGQIRPHDVANGPGVRVSVFVTGCTHNCYNCFNKEYQDFNYGDVWTQLTTDTILKLLDKPYIKGLSILGGEPLQNNLAPVLAEIREALRPDQNIWLWSGYTLDQIQSNTFRSNIVQYVDVLVDGLYMDELKDLNLKFRGSSNQNIIRRDEFCLTHN